MYSNELQTCDWPRNVGCEMVDDGLPTQPPPPRQQPMSSRIRFSSVPTTNHREKPEYQPLIKENPEIVQQQLSQRQPQQQQQRQQYQPESQTQRQQYQPEQQQQRQQYQPEQQQQQHQRQQIQQEPQRVQAQVRHSPPPPPEPLRIAPNPVITSRGQPKFLEPEEDIAKVDTTLIYFFKSQLLSKIKNIFSCMLKQMKLFPLSKRKNQIDNNVCTVDNPVQWDKYNVIVMVSYNNQYTIHFPATEK